MVSKHQPPPKVLDLRAYMHDDRMHKSTARVTSHTAFVFCFNRREIAEHCGDENLENVVHDSLSAYILQHVQVFRMAFNEREAIDIAHVLRYEEFREGQVLVERGHRMPNILIVQRGKLQVYEEGRAERTIIVSPDQVTTNGQHEEWLPIFMVGVRLLIYDLSAPCSIQAAGAMVEGWIMDIKSCDIVLKENGNLLDHLQTASYVMYCLRVALFKKLHQSDHRLVNMVKKCKVLEYWNQEEIIKEGELGDALFILVEGGVAVVVGGKAVLHLVADIDLDKVHYFGEMAILEHSNRTATVQVTSNSATALKVDLEVINECFGSVEALLEEQGTSAEALLRKEQQKFKAEADEEEKQHEKEEKRKKDAEEKEKKTEAELAIFNMEGTASLAHASESSDVVNPTPSGRRMSTMSNNSNIPALQAVPPEAAGAPPSPRKPPLSPGKVAAPASKAGLLPRKQPRFLKGR